MPKTTLPADASVTQEQRGTQLDASIPSAPSSPRKPFNVWILLLVILLVYIVLNIGVYMYGLKGLGARLSQLSLVKEQGQLFRPTPTPTLIPTPTPTPIRLPPGKGTYNVSQGRQHAGPTFTKISFDPLDVQKGETLTITVSVQNTVPIQSVQALLKTDHGQKNVQFARIDGTDLSGVWQAQIAMDDSVLYTYILQITATGANGVSSDAVAPRS